MKRAHFPWMVLWVVAGFMACALRVECAPAPAPMFVQAQLIWGTNDRESKYPAVDADLAAKLGKSPYRWTNYFEVNRQVVSLTVGTTKSVPMSEKCRLEIKNLGGDRVEVRLVGSGKLVSTHREKLTVDWPLVLSGNATGNTAWLVVIRKLDAKAARGGPPPL